jgi:ATP-dependent Clp protease protease subunit
MNNERRELIKIRTWINRTLAERCGSTEEQVAIDISRDFHLTSVKALNYGIIDKVIYKTRPMNV